MFEGGWAGVLVVCLSGGVVEGVFDSFYGLICVGSSRILSFAVQRVYGVFREYRDVFQRRCCDLLFVMRCWNMVKVFQRRGLGRVASMLEEMLRSCLEK